jgi:NDP-sugar pyrophosphorylase family protein
MQAAILCAGYGERLRPLTNVLPKPLIPILGQPLVGHIIKYLKQFGVDEIAVNTHWLAEKVHEYLGDGSEFGVEARISHEPEILGVGGGLGTMRDLIAEDVFIVHNGDILSNIDLKPAIKAHAEKKPLVTLILHDYPEFNTVEVVQNAIVGLRKAESSHSAKGTERLAYTGIAIMSKEMLGFLPYRKPCSIVDVWLELIRKDPGSVQGHVSRDHHWSDIGQVVRYLDLHREVLVDRAPLVSDIPVGSVYVGEDSTISSSARINGWSSIGRNCVIEDDCVIENCVIWDGVRIEKGRELKNAVVGKDFVVRANN